MSGLLHAILQMILFGILVFGAVKILAAVLTAAFPRLGSASKGSGRGGSKALRSPAPRAVRAAGRSAIAAAAHPTNGQVRTQARADARRAWTEVKATNWLEQQRHERANGTAPAGATATATATRPTIRQRLRLAPFVPAAAAGAGGNGTNGAAGAAEPNGTVPQAGQRGPGGTLNWAIDHSPKLNGDGTPPPPAPAASANGTPGGTTVAAGTSTASAEKLIEGINEIHAHAASGGIHAKREALAAMHEAAVRFAAMGQMVARTMSEPGSNYGNEITEPISKGAQQFQAGAITIGEAEANLTTLINMTVGDLATSPRQAPHHRELSENGAH